MPAQVGLFFFYQKWVVLFLFVGEVVGVHSFVTAGVCVCVGG